MKYYIRELRKIKRATVALAEQLFSELKVIKKTALDRGLMGRTFLHYRFTNRKINWEKFKLQ